jgi:protoheme IX farnesyltransferase
MTVIKSYFQLTKPRIMLLVVFSGATALLLEGSLLADPLRFFLALFSLYLTGGCANALNHYFDRDIDARMSRTRLKRPLPLKTIPLHGALSFALIIGLAGFFSFGLFFNWLSAILSGGTIFFYSIIYTLLLKPRTSRSIVIGGVAGAMAPVGLWAAASGSLDITPWVLFTIIFFWSPPHFYALCLYFKTDYQKSGLPMLPVARGEEATLNQIFIFSLVLFLSTLIPLFNWAGAIYLFSAVFMGLYFIKSAAALRTSTTPLQLKKVFRGSVMYLFVIFSAMIIDHFIPFHFLR